jgi:hypothetical protein
MWDPNEDHDPDVPVPDVPVPDVPVPDVPVPDVPVPEVPVPDVPVPEVPVPDVPVPVLDPDVPVPEVPVPDVPVPVLDPDVPVPEVPVPDVPVPVLDPLESDTGAVFFGAAGLAGRRGAFFTFETWATIRLGRRTHRRGLRRVPQRLGVACECVGARRVVGEATAAPASPEPAQNRATMQRMTVPARLTMRSSRHDAHDAPVTSAMLDVCPESRPESHPESARIIRAEVTDHGDAHRHHTPLAPCPGPPALSG